MKLRVVTLILFSGIMTVAIQANAQRARSDASASLTPPKAEMLEYGLNKDQQNLVDQQKKATKDLVEARRSASLATEKGLVDPNQRTEKLSSEGKVASARDQMNILKKNEFLQGYNAQKEELDIAKTQVNKGRTMLELTNKAIGNQAQKMGSAMATGKLAEAGNAISEISELTSQTAIAGKALAKAAQSQADKKNALSSYATDPNYASFVTKKIGLEKQLVAAQDKAAASLKTMENAEKDKDLFSKNNPMPSPKDKKAFDEHSARYADVYDAHFDALKQYNKDAASAENAQKALEAHMATKKK